MIRFMHMHCQTCKTTKNLLVNRRSETSTYYICRECNRVRSKKYRSTLGGKKAIKNATDKYEQSNPERVQAWAVIARSRMKKQPCFVCGEKKVHAHHPDPSRVLEVIFLCPFHHKQEHMRTRSYVETRKL